ncbi:MAG: Ig-like domain-containing protein [Anaerolineae bacterium]
MKPGLLSRLWLILLLAAVLPACTLISPGQEQTQTFSGPPVVEIVAPAPNNTYLEGVGVNIQISVSNAGPDIARVEFSIDNTVIGTADAPNAAGSAIFSATQRWTAEGQGEHTASVTVFRADNSSSAPAAVTFNVLAQAALAEETEAPDTSNQTTGGGTTGGTTGGGQATQAPTTAPTQAEPTAVPATDIPAATATPSGPMLTTNTGINVRSGPSTLFNPPLGGLAAGATSAILATNPARDWYKIQYFNSDGWVYSGNVTTSGDLSNLPIEQGPPLPTAAPTTVVLPTATTGTGTTTGGTGANGANLIANAPSFSVTPFCGVGYTISVNIVNTGNQPTGTGFFVIARVTGTGDTYPIEVNTAVSAIIQPQQNFVAQLPTITPVKVGGQTYTVTHFHSTRIIRSLITTMVTTPAVPPTSWAAPAHNHQRKQSERPHRNGWGRFILPQCVQEMRCASYIFTPATPVNQSTPQA